MSGVTIYHNPSCSKSRQTLALLRERGIEPTIVEYLQNPLDEAALTELSEQLGLSPRDLVRPRENRSLDLPDPRDDVGWIARLAAHPEIMQRPVVGSAAGARLGRPPERVLEIL